MNRTVLSGSRLLFIVVLLFAVLAPSILAQPARTVTVGVVRDGTPAGDRLLEQLQAELPSHLPAGVTWHLRIGWRWPTNSGEISAYLRADNLFDQRVDWQTGLPEPGRIISGGVGLSL